jgi:sugar lactone lactonase YvrE
MLLAGCGAAEPTATSVAEQVSPSDTPVPPTEPPAESPTDTPEPPPAEPSDTPVPPTEEPTEAPTGAPESPTDTPEPEPTEPPAPTDTPEPEAPPEGFLLEGVGFDTPESVRYDPEADVYLVSNINGDPRGKDGNGFISRVSPAGEVLELKWIDGEADGVTLNAPKGMALAGNALYVADLDAVRVFDRETGGPLADVVIEGAQFLNDMDAAQGGPAYVTDSATGLVYIVSPDFIAARFENLELKGPNGIVVTDGGFLVTAGGRILELDSAGVQTAEYPVPQGSLDGLVLLDDGSMLVSSWAGEAVYLIDPAGEVTTLFSGISGPADIGFDTNRLLVLIPHFNDNRVEVRPLP